jgi:ribosomal protein S27AE
MTEGKHCPRCGYFVAVPSGDAKGSVRLKCYRCREWVTIKLDEERHLLTVLQRANR